MRRPLLRSGYLRVLVLVTSIWIQPVDARRAHATPDQRSDPFFDEALFHAHQGDYLSALERLDAELAQHHGVDEPALDSLYLHMDEAEFSVGDLELRYRMHHRAGRALRAVLDAKVDAEIRADAAYRLARLHAQKGQPDEALDVLEAMPPTESDSLRADVDLLRGNVLMSLDRPEDAATSLERVRDSRHHAGFADFNLAIALLRREEIEAAALHLDRAGRVAASDRDTRAIRDKANLLAGSLLFEAGAYERAQQLFDRVRLSGPYSNQALLRAGWSELSAERFDRAVVPWSLLVDRDPTDAAVQEALLALPFAYSKLGVHGRAAILYESAAKTFGEELRKVDESLASVARGDFLRLLEDEQIRQDEQWVLRMRRRPGAPETHYLVALLASHEFQTALQNYLDLSDMRRKLADARRSLDAFDELIAMRRDFHEPRLPALDARFRELDAEMRVRLAHRDRLRERLEKMLTRPVPSMLVTSEEHALRGRLERLEAALEGSSAEARQKELLLHRIHRLRGVLDYRLASTYHQRLTRVHDHLRELESDVDTLDERYASFVRTRQATVHGYIGYTDQIATLRDRVDRSLQRIEALREEQGRALELVTRRALVARRDRLHAYQNKARFAFADSYDRASKRPGN